MDIYLLSSQPNVPGLRCCGPTMQTVKKTGQPLLKARFLKKVIKEYGGEDAKTFMEMMPENTNYFSATTGAQVWIGSQTGAGETSGTVTPLYHIAFVQ